MLILDLLLEAANYSPDRYGHDQMDFDVNLAKNRPKTSEILRLQKRIVRLKTLAKQYKRSECARDALIAISNIASTVSCPDDFYEGVHNHLKQLVSADNFFVAWVCPKTGKIEIPFYRDQKDNCTNYYDSDTLSDVLESGLTGYVLKTAKPFLGNKETLSQLIKEKKITKQGSSCRSWLGTPIMKQDKAVGVVVIQSYTEEDSYAQPEIELMSFICQHIAGMTERLKQNTQLEKAISMRTKELVLAYNELKQEINERSNAEKLQKSLFDIASLCSAKTEDNDFYQELYKILNQLIDAKNCYISLHDPISNSLYFPFHSTKQKQSNPNGRPFADGLTEYLIKHKKPLILTHQDIQRMINDKKIFQSTPYCLNTQEIKQWMAVPLHIHHKVRGALVLHHSDEDTEFQAKDLDILKFVSQHIARAIERKEAIEATQKNCIELERQVEIRTNELATANQELEKEIQRRKHVELQLIYDAKHDPLTSLPNRSMFMERLKQAINHIKRHPEDCFALIFIDLDKFKLINDTLGHLEGDRFLVETADRLKLCVRQNDTLGRLGGDEFVVILDGTQGKNNAIEIADRILQLLSQPYTLNHHKFYSSASIGIAISDANTQSSEAILKDADAAMYLAKSKGRGRYVIHQPITIASVKTTSKTT
ncbi:diguanylate cyclase [Parashewanella spongiae]|uniref:Diguanylate cyclase n=1 Tax=Parashewanella spongiae TaxID=342950 RepID=A0A3A6U8Z8_9GAMM|nr:diguanylate cyclase [Parashewanella spongiae]MCL1078526.1 diguanylate cyclase [Parashewanella spongiae]RJY13455.1 diguanylate cyclase [Parashewanella spongiae]